MEDISGLTELALIIGAGVVAAFICVKMRLPTLLGYLVAGILLSLVIPESLHSEFTENTAQLGAALLLFAIGIEFSLENIKKVAKIAIGGAVIQAIVVIIAALAILPTLGLGDYDAFFVGILVSMSSTAFVVKMLEMNEELHSRPGLIMLGWLVTQDVLIVMYFLLLQAFAPNATEAPNLILTLLQSGLFIGITFGIGKFVLPHIMKEIAKTRSDELLIVAVLGTIAIFAVFASLFEVSFTIGAFLAGLALSESFLNHEIFTELKPLKNMFLMIFFVSVGTIFDITAIGENLTLLLVILLGILSIKILSIIVINLWFGTDIRNSIKIGFGIAQIGEFAFLGAQLGLSLGWIDRSLYSIIVASAVISMAATPLLYANVDWVTHLLGRNLKRLNPRLYRSLFLHMEQNDVKNLPGDGHVVLTGFGRVGQYIALALLYSKIDFVIVELDANLVEMAREQEYKVIFGDASNPDILKEANIESARAIVVALPGREETSEVIREAKVVAPKLKAIVRANKLNQHIDLEYIDHLIEPEFEAAVSMVSKLYKVMHRGEKRALDSLRYARDQEWNFE